MDHPDVVAAVADGGDHLGRVRTQKLDRGGLLRGRAAADDDSRRGARHFDEELRVVLDRDLERRAVEHQARRVDRALRIAVEQLARLGRGASAHGVEGLVARHQRRVLRHDHRRLQLIAGEHPRTHVCVPHLLERRAHVPLQAILHSGDAQAAHVLLEHRKGLAHRRMPPRLHQASLGQLRGERRVLRLRQRAARDDERSEPLACEVARLLLEPVGGEDALGHDGVRALDVEGELARRHVPQQDAHALRLRSERHLVQHVVHSQPPRGLLQGHGRGAPRGEDEATARSKLHERELIGRSALEAAQPAA
mmetsp:Transcript_47937/g.125511  ORF Transcript_47937/g.125511 Transcript_47937/m.125511 type:complete len:308 (-) Transcript_47937:93-1016(-)